MSINHYEISGVSYIGKPRKNTAMFITRKVEHLLSNLVNINKCLVFAETGIDVPQRILDNNCFVFSKNPKFEYANFISEFYRERSKYEDNKRYTFVNEGYFLGENVKFGKDVKIEFGCTIGHGVVLGNNVQIRSGAIVKNAVLGNNVVVDEHAVIGSNGFAFFDDDNGNKFMLPSFGKVIVGNNVKIGAFNNIACGICDDTVIEDNVQLDALIHIGHEAHLYKNSAVAASSVIGGFVEIKENVFIGIHATIRNRITIGKNAFVGMGAVVTKSVDDNTVVAGVPAKELRKVKNGDK